MSTRRKPGDWVWLLPNSGFVGESHRLKAEIRPEHTFEGWAIAWVEAMFHKFDWIRPRQKFWDWIQEAPACTYFHCDDLDCIEWSTLWTEPDPQCGGKRHALCHVSECRMLDQPYKEEDER